MASVKLSWDWTDNDGKKGTTNVTDVNPNATNNDLVDFAQMLNNFTGNTYTGATKTTVEELYKTSDGE